MMNPSQRSRILIADHDQTFLDQLADRLLQMDMEVDFAENGRTAIQLLDSESYDLIITEIAMPIYNGLEILRMAKDSNPSTPILVTTFSATTDWAEQAMREGALAYLLRPLNNMREFDRAVKDALSHKQVPKSNDFFNHVLSKGMTDALSQTEAEIPMPDWERDYDLNISASNLELSKPKPVNSFQSVQDQLARTSHGLPGESSEARMLLPEGMIELNSQGQILNCDPAARNWLMLEANAPDRPIKHFIKTLGSATSPGNVEMHLNGRTIQLSTKRNRDRTGSERIILRIREVKKRSYATPQASMGRNADALKQREPSAGSKVDFGGNLQKYDPDMVYQGWSPLMFVDQVKRTIKDEVEKIKESNPLHIFEQPPEEVDPEVMMTMSQRLSDISRGRRTSYR
jgi:DNA-binding response OmpR family regulator